jgi:Zn-dependent protease
MDISPEQIRWILIYVILLVLSIALHEFGHAIVADQLGDDTPRRQGRVTLNPLAHADPVGTLMLPLLSSLFGAATGRAGGFGWGKPVEWQPLRVRRGISMSTAKILVAVAGPTMNVLLATAVAGVHAVLLSQHVLTLASKLSEILFFAVGLNLSLFFFNLLPVPPLDGGHVLESFMPYRHREKFEHYLRFSPFILLAIMLIPQVQWVFAKPTMFFTTQLYHLFGAF